MLKDEVLTYRAKNRLNRFAFAKLAGLSWNTVRKIEEGEKVTLLSETKAKQVLLEKI